MLKAKLSPLPDIKKLKTDGVTAASNILQKYPFIKLEAVKEAVEMLSESYYLSLQADKNDLKELINKADKEFKELGKIKVDKIKHITIKFNGSSTKSVKIETAPVISQIFRSLESTIIHYKNGVNTYTGDKATTDVRNFSKNALTYINSVHPTKFKSENKKYIFIADLVNCSTQLHPDGVAYDSKDIQALLKPKKRK